MKKTFSILLALVMLFTLGATAVLAESSEPVKIVWVAKE